MSIQSLEHGPGVGSYGALSREEKQELLRDFDERYRGNTLAELRQAERDLEEDLRHETDPTEIAEIQFELDYVRELIIMKLDRG